MQKLFYVRKIALLVAVFFLFFAAGEVLAAKVENVFAGKVLILKKRPPSHFKTTGGFVQFLRKNSKKVVYANEKNQWNFETMSFFRKPLGDYEVEMVFYDVENGKSKDKRKFVDSFTQYTQDRNTRILSGKARLTMPSFDANKSYMIIVQKRSKEVAKGYFSTKGISQAEIDQQKRLDYEMKQMEKSMKELQEKARKQEEEQKKKEQEQDKKAGDDMF